MSYVMYKVSDAKWAWRGPEVLYRDFDNDGNKDEANAAGDTFWALPVFIGADNPVLVRKRKKFTKRRSGSRYVKHINFDGYEEIVLVFNGPVYDRQWLYYLTDAITTTDNTPTGYNTHVYINTATHVNPPKSFELWNAIPNDKAGGGESVYNLYTGCSVISYKEVGNYSDGTIMGEWTVKAANEITAAALSSIPAYPNKDFFDFKMIGDGTTNFSMAKGGVAVNCYLKGYEFFFGTDKDLIKSSSYYAVGTKSPNNVDAYLKVTIAPLETDSYDDSQDDPHSALNKDVSLKIPRVAANDYFQCAFVDCFQELVDNPSWAEGNLLETHQFSINPHEATPSTMTLTEVNDIVDDRYET